MIFNNNLLTLLILTCSSTIVFAQTECDTVLTVYRALGGSTSQTNGCRIPGVSTLGGSRVWKISWRDNNLNGYIHPDIGRLVNLKYLFLNGNNIYGSIPSQIGSLTQLRRLNIEKNRLTGALPASIGNLGQLRRLWLRKNQLSGAIPREIGNLRNLIWLRLQFNQFSGSIPAELFNLNKLFFLNLRFNSLSGTIPNGIDKLNRLRELRMSYNQLSGNIPSDFGSLSKVYYMELHTNQLSGIPSSLVKLRATKIILPNPMSNIPYDIYAGSPLATLNGAHWREFLSYSVRIRRQLTSSMDTAELLKMCPLNDMFSRQDIASGCIAGIYNKYCLNTANLGACHSAYNTVLSNSIFSSLSVCAAWSFGPRSTVCAQAINNFRKETQYMTLTSTHAAQFKDSILSSRTFAPCVASTCKW